MAAAAQAAITRGALARIANGETVPNPVLQCVQLRPISGGSAAHERFRVVWNDVDNFIQSMLATQLNHLVNDGTIQKGHLVRLTQYQQQEVKGKKIIVVLNFEILQEHGIHEKIGVPIALDGTGSATGPTPDQPGAVSAGGFYGTKTPAAPQQQQAKPLPTRANGNYGNIYPIEALSPYAHKWTIKARCTAKTDIKTWHNKNGEGKLFSVNLLDETGEIRATGFNDQCDLLYNLFQEGGVYYITAPCRVTLAKKQFSQLNNDYELHFERDTQVEKVRFKMYRADLQAEDQENVPQIRYNFTNLADISSVDKDTVIDVIGVLREIGEVSQITSKTTSKPYDKRELTLVDNSNFSIRVTIWGNTAAAFEAQPESIAAFKGVKVSDFGGRSLSLLSSGTMALDPDIEESHRLKGWYDAQGRDDSFATHANALGGSSTGRKDTFKTISAIHDEKIGMGETAEYFSVKATVLYVKQDSVSYPACQTEGCNKKVVEIDPGQWRCEKCDRSWEKPLYRYVLSVNVSDHTGQMWLSCFDESGRMILGCSADELMEAKENDDRAYVEKMSEANCRSWNFRCRAKLETFQDQERVRYQVSSASAVNFAAESARLTEMIKQYNVDDDDLFVK